MAAELEKYTWTTQMDLLWSFFKKFKGPPLLAPPLPPSAMAKVKTHFFMLYKLIREFTSPRSKVSENVAKHVIG